MACQWIFLNTRNGWTDKKIKKEMINTISGTGKKSTNK